jgi:hypothetical protein
MAATLSKQVPSGNYITSGQCSSGHTTYVNQFSNSNADEYKCGKEVGSGTCDKKVHY